MADVTGKTLKERYSKEVLDPVVVEDGKVISGKTSTIGQAYSSGGGTAPSNIGAAGKGMVWERDPANPDNWRQVPQAQSQAVVQARTAAREQAVAQAKAQEQARQAAIKEAARKEQVAATERLRVERPAEQAARIERLNSIVGVDPSFVGPIQSTYQESPFGQLASKRVKELRAKSGKESSLAHYPTTQIVSKTKTKEGVVTTRARVGTQVEGERISTEQASKLTPKFVVDTGLDVARKKLSPPEYLKPFVDKVTPKFEEAGAKAGIVASNFAREVKDKYDKTDVFLKKTSSKIPQEWIDKPIQYAQRFRDQPSIKEKAFSIAEELRTGKKQDIKIEKKGIKKFFKEVTPATTEFSGGYVKGLKEQPTKTILSTALFFAAPPLLKGVSKTVGPIASTFPKTFGVVETVAASAIPGYYLRSIADRTKEADKPFVKLGEIASTEITPMVVGGVVGAYVWPKVYGFAGTIGKEKIAKELLIEPDVLSGAKTFPTTKTASAKQQLNLFLKESQRLPPKPIPKSERFKFKKFKSEFEKGDIKEIKKLFPKPREGKPTGFHAAPEPITKGAEFTITEGSSELPGLYVAPSVSKYFLKIKSGRSSFYSSKLLPPSGSPQIYALTPEKGFKIRQTIKTDSGYKWKNLAETEMGVADVPGIKTEIEAILSTNQKAVLDADRFYTTVDGVRVPIREFTALSEKGAESLIKLGKDLRTVSELKYDYYLPQRESITSPTTYALGLKLNEKVKTDSSKLSSIKEDIKSYKTSIGKSISSVSYSPSSSKSSKVSYSPSSSSSYKSSYKPSSKVSKVSEFISEVVSEKPTSYKSYNPPSSKVSYTSSLKTSSTSYTPRADSTKETPSYFDIKLPKKPTLWKKAFTVEVKRGGKFKVVGKRLPIGQALKKGSDITRKTLAATFRIKETGLTQARDIKFKPKGKIFREYSIRGGQRVDTPLTFIQRRGTRLGTRGEVGEIKTAKKRKKKKRRI